MNQLKLYRHYIFIDPNNIHCDINNHNILNEIKSIHNEYYTNNEIVKYWSYDDIVILLKKYDNELCELFLSINYNYPALLADIGRYIILYYYGGIYHDLKCISNKNMVTFLNENITIETFIGEEHPDPSLSYRVRNTNIISLQINHPILNLTLQKMKENLIIAKNNNYCGHQFIWSIGSNIYIKIFDEYKNENIIKYPLIKQNLIVYNNIIYSKNIKKWQHIDELLFRTNQ